MIEPKDITGIILAGGKSSRFGSNKALSCLNGDTLLQYAVNLLQPFCKTLAISGDCDAYRQHNLCCIPDLIPGLGPLGGIYSTMVQSDTRYLLYLTCDMPLMQPYLLNRLLTSDKDTEITCWEEINGELQLFPMLMDRALLPLIKWKIRNQQLNLRSLLGEAECRCFEISPFEKKWFLNINKKSDLDELILHVS